MAANEYYNTQNTSLPEPSHLHPQYPCNASTSPAASSRASSESNISDRGFLTPSSNQPELKKSKSDRALNFAKKQVKKQIEKKLNGGNKHGGSGGHLQDQFIEATQGDSTGANGGEYGYGDASGGYGATGGDYGAASGAGAGGAGGDYGSGAGGGDGGYGASGGEYGYGDSSGGYGLTEGDFGGAGGEAGNFDFGGAGEGASGFWESLASGDFDFDV